MSNGPAPRASGTQPIAAVIVADALSPRGLAWSTPVGLDLIERILVTVTACFFAARMIQSFYVTPNIIVALLLIAELLPAAMIIFRKFSGAMSGNPLDWILALVGSSAPLLFVPGVYAPPIPAEICSVLILGGLLTQISAKVILGRSFGIVAAARETKVIGPYRFIRHPMYAGYTMTHIGFLLAFPSLWNLAVCSCALIVQIARVFREEKILNGDALYREFSSRVRYRLLPGVF